MKVCRRCKQELPRTKFYHLAQRNAKGEETSWDCRDSFCKKCRGKYQTERLKVRKSQAVTYLGGQCVDCALIDPVADVYDFHHRDSSEKDFSIGKTTKSFERIKVELDKCDLLCANCHRRRHAKSV